MDRIKLGQWLCIAALLIPSSVFAFSGTWEEEGVYGQEKGISSVGIHISMNGRQPIFQVEYRECSESERAVGAECCDVSRIYFVDGQELCCPTDKILENGACIAPLCDEMTCLGASYCRQGSCICENGNTYMSYLDDPCSGDTFKNYIGCRSNADCAGSEYCNLFGARENGCVVISSGSCQSLEGRMLLPAIDFVDKNANVFKKRKYLSSASGLTWWAGENWCHAQDRVMVSLSDLYIKTPAEDGCTESACEDLFGNPVDWNVLREVIGGVNWWVKDTYNECYAWRVNAKERRIDKALYNTTSAYALCE